MRDICEENSCAGVTGEFILNVSTELFLRAGEGVGEQSLDAVNSGLGLDFVVDDLIKCDLGLISSFLTLIILGADFDDDDDDDLDTEIEGGADLDAYAVLNGF